MRGERSPLLVVGGAILLALVAVAVLAPLLAPYDPKAPSGASLAQPSPDHLLGTNVVGQDNLSQLVWGSRQSLLVALGAATVTTVVGVLVGAGAALLGKGFDTLVLRTSEFFLAVPVLPLLIVIVALASPTRTNVILTMGLIFWPGVARVVRGEALTLRSRGFVEAAQGFGAGPLYVLRRHLVPALGPIVVTRLVSVASIAVLLEAGLAFLGLGDVTDVSWGSMLNEAVRFQGVLFSPAWVWLVLPAGFAIALAGLGFTFLGVGLEPRFNPRWHRSS